MNISDDVREVLVLGLSALLTHPKFEHSVSTLGAAMQWLDSLPAAPEPDWSQAPEWVMWWAVDPDGSAYWYEDEPGLNTYKDLWEGIANDKPAGEVDLPIGIDWRTTLRCRPEADNV